MQRILRKITMLINVFILFSTLGYAETTEKKQKISPQDLFSEDWFFTGDSREWEGVMPIYRVVLENDKVLISIKNYGDDEFTDFCKGSVEYNGDMEVTESTAWDWDIKASVPLLTYNADMTIIIDEQWFPDENRWGEVQWWQIENERMLSELLRIAVDSDIILQEKNYLLINSKVILKDGVNSSKRIKLYSSEKQATDKQDWK